MGRLLGRHLPTKKVEKETTKQVEVKKQKKKAVTKKAGD